MKISLVNAVIDETEDKEVKLASIENQLKIYARLSGETLRYLFEKLYLIVEDEFLFTDQLNEIMLTHKNKLIR